MKQEIKWHWSQKVLKTQTDCHTAGKEEKSKCTFEMNSVLNNLNNF